MSLLKRLHLYLVPALSVLIVIAGALTYHQRLSGYKDLEETRWRDKVLGAIEASKYEERGVAALAHEIAGTAQFIRLLQDTGDLVRRSFVEKHLSLLVAKERVAALGGVKTFVADELFNIIISSQRSGPFDVPTLSDDIYQLVFDMHVKVSLGDMFIDDGFTYQLANGEIRYTYVGAYSEQLFPEDSRSNREPRRSLLITDGPLLQLSALYKEIESLPCVIMDFSDVVLFSPSNLPTQTYEKENNRIIGGQSLRFSNDQMTIGIHIMEEHYFDYKKELLIQTAVYVILVELILLLTIFFVIRYRIISPIKLLIEDIRTGGQELRYFKRSRGKDEISVLKNAYIDTLSKVKFEADFDNLTRLANRRTFITHIEKRIECYSNQQTYVVGWDVKEFRKINDLYGTKVGDLVLVQLAECIRHFVCEHQTKLGLGCSDYSISRYSSNRFLAVLEADSHQRLRKIITEFERSMKTSINIDGYNFSVDTSTAVFPIFLEGYSHLWQKGLEEAFIKARKIRSLQSFVLFDEELICQLERRDEIEKILLECCENGDFVLNFMPLINSASLEIEGLEVLIRCPKLYDLNAGPDEFIQIAEKANIIVDIDSWVFDNAFFALSNMHHTCNYQGSMSVNVSALELYNEFFIENITKSCDRYNIPHHLIIIEITETSYVKSTKETVGLIAELRGLGFRVSLDDFGTGFTSINQLLNYPVDELKIDKSFVDRIGVDANDERMLFSIISLAHTCGAKVVGEGVEDGYQCQYLSKIGCDSLQGYLFSKPLNYDDFCAFYESYSPSEMAEKYEEISIIGINR
ncbi:EAL domain-containing protein [Vibrio sp. E150_011]